MDKVCRLTELIGGLIQPQTFQPEAQTSEARAFKTLTLRSCLKSSEGVRSEQRTSSNRSVRFRAEESSAQRPKPRDLRGKAGCTGCGKTHGSHKSSCFARSFSSDPSQDRRGLRGCCGCGGKKGGHAANCEQMNQPTRLGAPSDVHK